MDIRILDEHQEVYVCLDELAKSGRIRRPLALVHVDSHEDLEAPLGGESCYDLSARRYVERNLTAGDFILPSLLKGYVKKVVHVNDRDEACVKMNVGSLRGEGRFIRSGIESRYLKYFPDARRWRYQKTSDIAALADTVRGYDVVLDIDCDYFSWRRVPRAAYPFSWTREQRETLQRHTRSDDGLRLNLRLLPHQMPTINGLTFNDSKVWIERLIDYFCFYQNLSPRFVFISRSVKSGFTPKKYAAMIEKRLARGLQNRPDRPALPLAETLSESPFMAGCGKQAYCFSTDRTTAGDPLEEIIVAGAARGETISAIRRRLMAMRRGDERPADYLLLRGIFNLKKKFIIR